MRSRNSCWTLLAAVMIVATLQAEAAAFRQADYAYSATLQVSGAGPAYVVSLPAEVYRSVTRADLTDLCVVNASGEVVPFAVRRPEAPRSRSPQPVNLRLFPIRSASEGSGQALRLRLCLMSRAARFALEGYADLAITDKTP